MKNRAGSVATVASEAAATELLAVGDRHRLSAALRARHAAASRGHAQAAAGSSRRFALADKRAAPPAVLPFPSLLAAVLLGSPA